MSGGASVWLNRLKSALGSGRDLLLSLSLPSLVLFRSLSEINKNFKKWVGILPQNKMGKGENNTNKISKCQEVMEFG